MRLLAFFVALLLASPSFADRWSSDQLTVNRQHSYSFVLADGTGLSKAVNAQQCATIVTGWERATSATATLLACPNSTSDAIDCTSIGGFTANAAGSVVNPGMPFIKVDRTAAPTDPDTASLWLYCSDNAGSPGDQWHWYGTQGTWLTGDCLRNTARQQSVSNCQDIITQGPIPAAVGATPQAHELCCQVRVAGTYAASQTDELRVQWLDKADGAGSPSNISLTFDETEGNVIGTSKCTIQTESSPFGGMQILQVVGHATNATTSAGYHCGVRWSR